MAGRGACYALTDEQRAELLRLTDADDRIDYVGEVIGEAAFVEPAEDEPAKDEGAAHDQPEGEPDGDEPDEDSGIARMPGGAPVALLLDKAWDALHRCLASQAPGGEDLDPKAGSYPLNLCIVGGRQLVEGREDYIMNLVEPQQVTDLAAAIAELDRAWCEAQYRAHAEGAWPDFSDEGMDYTCHYFERLRDWLVAIAPSGRAVLFAADL